MEQVNPVVASIIESGAKYIAAVPESAALSATDITRFGGWTAYLRSQA